MSSANVKSILKTRPLMVIGSAIVAVPLMACNYKGSRYDVLISRDDAGTSDGGALDAGATPDAGAQIDGGEASTPVDAGTTEQGESGLANDAGDAA